MQLSYLAPFSMYRSSGSEGLFVCEAAVITESDAKVKVM